MFKCSKMRSGCSCSTTGACLFHPPLTRPCCRPRCSTSLCLRRRCCLAASHDRDSAAGLGGWRPVVVLVFSLAVDPLTESLDLARGAELAGLDLRMDEHTLRVADPAVHDAIAARFADFVFRPPDDAECHPLNPEAAAGHADMLLALDAAPWRVCRPAAPPRRPLLHRRHGLVSRPVEHAARGLLTGFLLLCWSPPPSPVEGR